MEYQKSWADRLYFELLGLCEQGDFTSAKLVLSQINAKNLPKLVLDRCDSIRERFKSNLEGNVK